MHALPCPQLQAGGVRFRRQGGGTWTVRTRRVVKPFLPSSSDPQDVSSGVRAPTLAACPQPSLTQALHACSPIRPCVCLLLTSVSLRCCPGWPGAGLQASWEECGRHTGSSLPSPEKAPSSHARNPLGAGRGGVPGSCSALGLVAVAVFLFGLQSEAGQVARPWGGGRGLEAEVEGARASGPGLVREEGSLHLPAPACCPPVPACHARLRPHLVGFSFSRGDPFVHLFVCSLSLSLPLPLSLFFFFFLFSLLSSVLCTQAAH